MSEQQAPDQLVPPPGFKFNPDLLLDFDEQVQAAIEEAAYQAEPIPSFEGVPTLDITPTFNPTGAANDEIYARNRAPRPKAMAPIPGIPESTQPGVAIRSDLTDDPSPVEMWRIVERAKLLDGTGLVASRILHDNTLGDVEGFDDTRHLLSNHARRVADAEAATPFVSFSTDPKNLAERVILRHGFGIKGGRDSVVVRVRVDPDRVITSSANKDAEVLLLGGVAPQEYVAAYDVADFVAELVPGVEITTVTGDKVHRDKALGYWALRD